MGNPLGCPLGNPMGNPMGHPRGRPMGHPRGNSMGYPMGSPMGNSIGDGLQIIPWEACGGSLGRPLEMMGERGAIPMGCPP